MSRSYNPFGRGFSVEDFVDRGQTRDNRQARDNEIAAQARKAVSSALARCEASMRGDLSLALIAEAATAAAGEVPPEQVQSHLGKVAHDHGATIKPQKPAKAAAEAMFRRGAA